MATDKTKEFLVYLYDFLEQKHYEEDYKFWLSDFDFRLLTDIVACFASKRDDDRFSPVKVVNTMRRFANYFLLAYMDYAKFTIGEERLHSQLNPLKIGEVELNEKA